MGRATDAERIVRNVARADLLEDWTPHENVNGNTGANEGFPIQGWNGALFATLYFGALGVDRLSASEMRVAPQIRDRDFDTWLVLPEGRARVRRVDGKLRPAEIPQSLPYRIVVEQSQLTSSATQ